MNSKKWLIFPTIIVIGIVVMSVVAYNQLVTSTTLSEKEISSRIEALYGGKVESIEKAGRQYNVTFSVDDYIYEVVANEEYGTFEQLVVIKEGTPPKEPEVTEPPAEDDKPTETKPEPEPEPATEPTPQSKPEPEPEPVKPTPAPEKPKPVRLTEQQAIAIARQNAAGTVEDIEFYDNNNGGYYIVELENESEDDDGDVTLQIHAITGKILSVSFDD